VAVTAVCPSCVEEQLIIKPAAFSLENVCLSIPPQTVLSQTLITMTTLADNETQLGSDNDMAASLRDRETEFEWKIRN
jgi:hypothetical protein